MSTKSFLLFISSFFLVVSFISCKKKLPEVSTYPISNITYNAAQSGGKVEAEGDESVNLRGICWSIYPEPNINNDRADQGQGGGSFSAQIMNLLPNTTYYVRAFARSEAGTGYGNEVEFTTADAPVFTVPSFTHNGTTYYVHPSDNSQYVVWGPQPQTTGADSESNGAQNTATLDALSSTYAAKLCSELDAYGYSDWYLPSKDELNLLFIHKNTIGGFNEVIGYWSSTEYDNNNAWKQSFDGGQQLVSGKGSMLSCRCVRKD